MRINPIQSNINQAYAPRPMQGVQRIPYATNSHATNPFAADTVSFTGKRLKPLLSPLKELVHEGIPCFYTGRIMLPESVINSFINSGAFSKPPQQVIKTLEPLTGYMQPVEREVFELIKKEVIKAPEKDLQDIYAQLYEGYKRRLIFKQNDVFRALKLKCGELPFGQQLGISYLLKIHANILEDKPVLLTFKKQDFIYKLQKFREENSLPQHIDKKIKAHCNALKNLHRSASPVGQLDRILNTLRRIPEDKRGEMEQVVINALKAYDKKEGVETFSRQAFLYRLNEELEGISYSHGSLRQEILNIAETLPSSRDDIDAFVIKYSKKPADKTWTRLLGGSVASHEHLNPSSNDGSDELSNLVLACAIHNSERSNITLNTYLSKNPEAKEHIINYLNRMQELENNGTLKKYGISDGYAWNIAQTLEKETKGRYPDGIFLAEDWLMSVSHYP